MPLCPVRPLAVRGAVAGTGGTARCALKQRLAFLCVVPAQDADPASLPRVVFAKCGVVNNHSDIHLGGHGPAENRCEFGLNGV